MEGEKGILSNVRSFDYKSKIIDKCLNDLYDFVMNQSFNITPDMKYGTINPQRQKVTFQKIFNNYSKLFVYL